jgi:hypothetical protein
MKKEVRKLMINKYEIDDDIYQLIDLIEVENDDEFDYYREKILLMIDNEVQLMVNLRH